ncbi:phosphopantetheine attachment site-containing protein [Nocardia nova SH22a]|uniref:Phosphopantetheine attachment site-containing protein n=1 Tax=Nocardia nova SH22a TaxID=1415166 RepID=W5TM33_9NOCA|nr:phosphopantetheine-binding protein [Nocardia nova]AHH18311.1 phosphopantetheine attachment site-containing protein [Nocardia nova SH22a]
MSTTVSRQPADTAVRAALRGFATDTEIAALDQDTPLRTALELDSLDFLTFVERLSDLRTEPIAESDYHRLSTIRTCVDFLTDGPGAEPR